MDIIASVVTANTDIVVDRLVLPRDDSAIVEPMLYQSLGLLPSAAHRWCVTLVTGECLMSHIRVTCGHQHLTCGTGEKECNEEKECGSDPIGLMNERGTWFDVLNCAVGGLGLM
jgi:hypothetical protein